MRIAWTVLSTLVVVAGVGVAYWFPRRDAPAEAAPPARVVAERDYYVLLHAIEVAPEAAPGRSWDVDGSAPDLYYEVWWQGHKVFVSATKKDTLTAVWSNAAVGVGAVVGGVSVDDSIKAARVTARAGQAIEFRVYDDDLAGDDLAGRFEVPLDGLLVGDQEWEKPAGSIVRVRGRVIPVDGVDLDELTR
jgi:hypothetical protein